LVQHVAAQHHVEGTKRRQGLVAGPTSTRLASVSSLAGHWLVIGWSLAGHDWLLIICCSLAAHWLIGAKLASDIQ